MAIGIYDTQLSYPYRLRETQKKYKFFPPSGEIWEIPKLIFHARISWQQFLYVSIKLQFTFEKELGGHTAIIQNANFQIPSRRLQSSRLLNMTTLFFFFFVEIFHQMA